MNEIKLGNRVVSPNHPPFIIAEMSGNHNHSLERALAIIDAAAAAGAHAFKIQTYTADTLTIDVREREFFIKDPNSLWKGKSLYELYQEAYTPWEWHKPIKDHCEKRGMIFFSTPFDHTAVDFLEDLGVSFYKIASFEMVDLALIKKVAATKKPIIMSTGMATLGEITEAVAAARSGGCKDIILLKCTSAYPALAKEANLKTIPHMAQTLGVQVGLSDHTMGLGVALASIAMGATVIEKHFTLARADGGVDSAFSLEPHELKELVTESQKAWESLGHVNYERTDAEKKSIVFRRSLYIVSDMKAGEVLTAKNLRSIRPGLGMECKYLDQVLGKKITKDASRGTPLSWDLLG